MDARRLLGDEELGADLAIRAPIDEQREDLHLTGAEAPRIGRVRDSRSRSARRGAEIDARPSGEGACVTGQRVRCGPRAFTAEANKLAEYRSGVKAQSGKAFPAEKAGLLIAFSYGP